MLLRHAFLALAVLVPLTAQAAGSDKDAQSDVAIHAARIETLRARAAMAPSATTSTTLIEADNLLRQLRQAPPDKRAPIRAQLDAALGRLELEIDSANRAHP